MNRPSVPTDIEEFERALADCVSIATRSMPDAPMVSIALCGEDGLRTVACSHARAELLDELQSITGQGPSLDALGTGEPVTSGDAVSDARWQRFTAESGLKSLHSEPLKSEGLMLGVLTLYSREGGGFAEATRVTARVTAEHIGLLFRAALDAARMKEVAAQLKEALNTRAVIDQALGIVMAQRRCTSQQAFEMLRHVSQDKNVKLYQVAAGIVRKVTGEAPQRPRFEDPPPRVRPRVR
ncbi:GAF and ANTAR domain-containing protein [Actinomadura sp. ATCC 31491]|uniref:GAF and ANTAR domain-containing protein n=1 Tax=Actinomadura luzonensis TaxID=2805427 RepID=A0ABT0G6E4_9ACTN|nr:GAF and ANTAR domain-containing protein [Actinomadura luzonensis]MCK2219661.1 GAF and ANTAR domain-containing protein [Actinomadura luzonensis]